MSKISAINVLRSEQQEIEGLFHEFCRQKHARGKLSVSQRICRALFNLAQIEEEVVYPAFGKGGIPVPTEN